MAWCCRAASIDLFSNASYIQSRRRCIKQGKDGHDLLNWQSRRSLAALKCIASADCLKHTPRLLSVNTCIWVNPCIGYVTFSVCIYSLDNPTWWMARSKLLTYNKVKESHRYLVHFNNSLETSRCMKSHVVCIFVSHGQIQDCFWQQTVLDADLGTLDCTVYIWTWIVFGEPTNEVDERIKALRQTDAVEWQTNQTNRRHHKLSLLFNHIDYFDLYYNCIRTVCHYSITSCP